MKTNNIYDVFISYNSSNKNNAKKLASYLDDNGIKVWFDDWNLIVGENLVESISNAIKNSKIIFTLVDSNYLNSKWIKKVLDASVEKNKKNIFLIDKSLDSFNSSSLDNFQCIKIDYENLDNLLEKLQDIDNLFKVKYLSINAKKLYDEGNYQFALHVYNRLLEISGKNSENILTAYNNIASIYQIMGDYSKSLRLYIKTLEMQEEIFGVMHPNIAITYNNIASIYQIQGEYHRALEFYLIALKMQKEIFGDTHPDIATTYNNIASIYQIRGEYCEALELYFQTLEIRKKIFGEMHLNIAITYNNIASIYQMLGEYDKALEFYSIALKIQEEVLGKIDPDIGRTYNNLALLFYEREDYDKAYEYMEQSIKILDSFLDKNNEYLENSKKFLSKIKLRKKSKNTIR